MPNFNVDMDYDKQKVYLLNQLNGDLSGLKVIKLIGNEEFLDDLAQIIEKGDFPKDLKEFEFIRVK